MIAALDRFCIFPDIPPKNTRFVYLFVNTIKTLLESHNTLMIDAKLLRDQVKVMH